MPDLSRLAAVAVFGASGILHFARPQWYRAIVPPSFPSPDALVAISGAAELAGAAGLLIGPLRRPASLGLAALLVAIFPANLSMAQRAQDFASVAPRWVLFARLPFQPLMVWWVWNLGRGPKKDEDGAA